MKFTYLLGTSKTQYKIGDDGSVALRHIDPAGNYGQFTLLSAPGVITNPPGYIANMVAAGCVEIAKPELNEEISKGGTSPSR